MRLNKKMRADIIRAAEQKLFHKKFEELEKDMRELVLKVYSGLVADPVRVTLKSLPQHLVVRTSGVCLRWQEERNQTRTLSWRRKSGYGDSVIPLHDPIYHPGTYMELTKPLHIKRAQVLQQRQVELLSLRSKAKKEIETLVNQATTVEQLEQAWPEGKKYLKEFKDLIEGKIEKEKSKPPTVVVDTNLLKEALK